MPSSLLLADNFRNSVLELTYEVVVDQDTGERSLQRVATSHVPAPATNQPPPARESLPPIHESIPPSPNKKTNNMAVNGVHDRTEPNGTQNGATPAAADPKSEIPKDEVGWYFVEQYYTTLSRTPEKLHLFYNRKSQFVTGVETEKVDVCIGQKVCWKMACACSRN